MSLMTSDLVAQALAGDGDAFRQLTEPHRRELQVHCYRMLGSFKDAEDVLQETMLAAWQGLPAFRGQASLRTWLYRIATNRCLNARRAVSRRAAKEWDIPGVEPPQPTQLGEVVWLEPLPDGPEGRYEQTESISLAFITALQTLPPKQIAVLVLRDVLDFHAAEVATMLDTSVDAVHSALKRARATLERKLKSSDREAAPPRNSAAEAEITAKFVRAYEAADVKTLVTLLTDDVFMSMPPMPLEYIGRAAVETFFTPFFTVRRKYKLVRTRANCQPAFGLYFHGPDGVYHATGLVVIELVGSRISALIRFENSVLPSFGLPRTLPV